MRMLRLKNRPEKSPERPEDCPCLQFQAAKGHVMTKTFFTFLSFSGAAAFFPGCT